MKRLVMMLVATSLVMIAAPFGRTESIPETAAKDKVEAARVAEENGDLARLHKDNMKAVAYYQAAIRLSRQNAELYNKLGIVELKLDERGAARKQFAQAAKLDPRLTSALNNLGAVALLDKKYKSAASYFKQALALDESVASTHLNLAEAWMGLKQIDRAMTEYARALELDADVLSDSEGGAIAQVMTPEQHARVLFLIAKSYMKRGNLDGALDYLGRAKEGHYRDLASVYSDSDFAPLWKDPRLAKIVSR
ncbi:MAG: tetratricopeptide repeat protein [Terracidiphilus sp.]|jgi:tetratricopeptide (TPR) repeat protein